MEKRIGGKRCSCSKALDDLIDNLAERVEIRKHFKNMSTAGKLVGLQSTILIPEIIDCDCDAGLVMKRIMKEILRRGTIRDRKKIIQVFTVSFGRKVGQKIKSIFPSSC